MDASDLLYPSQDVNLVCASFKQILAALSIAVKDNGEFEVPNFIKV